MAALPAWSIKGIDKNTRELAKLAAAAEGMTLGGWLEKLILGDTPASLARASLTDPQSPLLKDTLAKPANENQHHVVPEVDLHVNGPVLSETASYFKIQAQSPQLNATFAEPLEAPVHLESAANQNPEAQSNADQAKYTASEEWLKKVEASINEALDEAPAKTYPGQFGALPLTEPTNGPLAALLIVTILASLLWMGILLSLLAPEWIS